MSQIETLQRYQLVPENKPRKEKNPKEGEMTRRELLENAGVLLAWGGLLSIPGGFGFGVYRLVQHELFNAPQLDDEINNIQGELTIQYKDLYSKTCTKQQPENLKRTCEVIEKTNLDITKKLAIRNEQEANFRKDGIIAASFMAGGLAGLVGGVTLFKKNDSGSSQKR